MAGSVPLKYHALALRLLGRTPRVSAEAARAIEKCEARCGRRLPAAVREWYTLEGAQEALAEIHGSCGFNSLHVILKAFAAAVARPAPGEPDHLPFYGPW